MIKYRLNFDNLENQMQMNKIRNKVKIDKRKNIKNRTKKSKMIKIICFNNYN